MIPGPWSLTNGTSWKSAPDFEEVPALDIIIFKFHIKRWGCNEWPGNICGERNSRIRWIVKATF